MKKTYVLKIWPHEIGNHYGNIPKEEENRILKMARDYGIDEFKDFENDYGYKEWMESKPILKGKRGQNQDILVCLLLFLHYCYHLRVSMHTIMVICKKNIKSDEGIFEWRYLILLMNMETLRAKQ